MFGKLFWKIASLKTSWSEKSDKYRSSRSQMFFKIAGIKDFAVFTGKHLCWSLFGLRACSFVGGRLRLECFLWARLWWLLLLVAVAVRGGGVAAVVRGMYGAGSGFGGGWLAAWGVQFLFWLGNWSLGYYYLGFQDFPNDS